MIKIKDNTLTVNNYIHISAKGDIILIVRDTYPIIKIEGWMSCDFSDTLTLVWALGILTVKQGLSVRCFELTNEKWREL